MKSKIKEKQKNNNLLKIFIDSEGSIGYQWNLDNSELIIQNHVFLYGILGLIQKRLLELEEIQEETQEESNSEGPKKETISLEDQEVNDEYPTED